MEETFGNAVEEEYNFKLIQEVEGLNGGISECLCVEEVAIETKELKDINGLALKSHRQEDEASGKPAHKLAPISALKQNGILQSLTAGKKEEADAELNHEVQQAEDEWAALEAVQPVISDHSGSCSSPISFNEALQHFQTTDLSDIKGNIQPTLRRRGLAAVAHFLFGPPRLHRELQEERDLVFTIAQCSLDNNQKIHIRVLQTIYKKLTGARFDCPRYGTHWEQLGFQGTDPGTDLRGTGFLGLMNTLYLVMDPQMLPLAREIYKLSQHPVQNFPFCVMSINVTRIAIHALREEVLTKECNKRQQVVGVLNDFYVATFLQLYQIWKAQHKTISDSGIVLKEVESVAKKNPKQLLRRLESYLSEQKSGASALEVTSPSPSPNLRVSDPWLSSSSSSKDLKFIGVCELPPEMEGEARLI
uniref:ELMO domain containing 3 n=1 Tax=Erpetoichthys calabaricus TaxID=27687 RepID=A0A8C4RCB0_ERPCA